MRVHARVLSLSLALSLLLGSGVGGPPVAAQPATYERYGGSGRIATAVAISRAHWPEAPVALLATAGGFADALASGALAKAEGAPLLLTERDLLPDIVAAELERLGARRILLLGGQAAIGDAVAAAVAGLSTRPAVERIAGLTRFHTAAAVAARVGAPGEVAVVASGEHYADALAAATVSASDVRAPVLLTARDHVPEPTMTALQELRARTGGLAIIVLGGRTAVSDAAVHQLEQAYFWVTRLSGGNRYETALAVLRHTLDFYLSQEARPLVVATGGNFPDALPAGALSARLGGVFLPVPPEWPLELHRRLALYHQRLSRLVVIGGAQAVPDSTARPLARALDDEPWDERYVDPLGLARGLEFMRVGSLGEDHWEVFACAVPEPTADERIPPGRWPVDLERALDDLEILKRRYWDVLSGGVWQPRYRSGGTVAVDASEEDVAQACVSAAIARARAETEGVILVANSGYPGAFGGGSYGVACGEEGCVPDYSLATTRRAAFFGTTEPDPRWVIWPPGLAHELGHTLTWPHTFRKNPDGDEYETPGDVMSTLGAYIEPSGWQLPVGTMAWNRYIAGWMDPETVAVHESQPSMTYEVAPLGEPGVQMVAVPGREDGALLVVEARVASGIDRGLSIEGVFVMAVDQRPYLCGQTDGICGGGGRRGPAIGAYKSAEHVLEVGDRVDVHGVTIEVLSRDGDHFTVRLDGAHPDVPPMG